MQLAGSAHSLRQVRRLCFCSRPRTRIRFLGIQHCLRAGHGWEGGCVWEQVQEHLCCSMSNEWSVRLLMSPKHCTMTVGKVPEVVWQSPAAG